MDFSSRVLRFALRKCHYWLNFDCREAIGGYRKARAFLLCKPSDETVLIIEPNRYHAEVLPGYCHYFHRLGFKVVVLMRRDNERSDPFARLANGEKPITYAMHPRLMRRVLDKQASPANFAFVFISSAYWAEAYGYYGPFCSFLGDCPEGRLGYAMVVHEREHMQSIVHAASVPLSCLSQLSPSRYNGTRIPMINPHYFGAVTTRPVRERRVFTIIGTQFRNFDRLLSAVRDLQRQGCDNFVVRVIGRAGATQKDHPDAPDFIDFLGRLDFPELYEQLEDADFLLPLLDPAIDSHRRYLDGATSGARQLILGFLKVPIIEETFARVYGFSAESAIIYPSNELADAMLRAMKVTREEYEQLRGGVADLRNAVEAESLCNLRRQLSLNEKYATLHADCAGAGSGILSRADAPKH